MSRGERAGEALGRRSGVFPSLAARGSVLRTTFFSACGLTGAGLGVEGTRAACSRIAFFCSCPAAK